MKKERRAVTYQGWVRLIFVAVRFMPFSGRGGGGLEGLLTSRRRLGLGTGFHILSVGYFVERNQQP